MNEELYTCGSWTVVPGREEEFVAAWADLADWTSANVRGSRWATLVQSQESPNRFVSFGPWESAQAIDEWRASAGFQDRVKALRGLLEDFTPGTFEERAHVDPTQ